MPSAQDIYNTLVKDPDLEIGEHQTREEAAQVEADYRARQHSNNVRALSLANEPLKKASPIQALLNHVSSITKMVVEGSISIAQNILKEEGKVYETIGQVVANHKGKPFYEIMPNVMQKFKELSPDGQKFFKSLAKTNIPTTVLVNFFTTVTTNNNPIFDKNHPAYEGWPYKLVSNMTKDQEFSNKVGMPAQYTPQIHDVFATDFPNSVAPLQPFKPHSYKADKKDFYGKNTKAELLKAASLINVNAALVKMGFPHKLIEGAGGKIKLATSASGSVEGSYHNPFPEKSAGRLYRSMTNGEAPTSDTDNIDKDNLSMFSIADVLNSIHYLTQQSSPEQQAAYATAKEETEKAFADAKKVEEKELVKKPAKKKNIAGGTPKSAILSGEKAQKAPHVIFGALFGFGTPSGKAFGEAIKFGICDHKGRVNKIGMALLQDAYKKGIFDKTHIFQTATHVVLKAPGILKLMEHHGIDLVHGKTMAKEVAENIAGQSLVLEDMPEGIDWENLADQVSGKIPVGGAPEISPKIVAQAVEFTGVDEEPKTVGNSTEAHLSKAANHAIRYNVAMDSGDKDAINAAFQKIATFVGAADYYKLGAAPAINKALIENISDFYHKDFAKHVENSSTLQDMAIPFKQAVAKLVGKELTAGGIMQQPVDLPIEAHLDDIANKASYLNMIMDGGTMAERHEAEEELQDAVDAALAAGITPEMEGDAGQNIFQTIQDNIAMEHHNYVLNNLSGLEELPYPEEDVDDQSEQYLTPPEFIEHDDKIDEKAKALNQAMRDMTSEADILEAREELNDVVTAALNDGVPVKYDKDAGHSINIYDTIANQMDSEHHKVYLNSADTPSPLKQMGSDAWDAKDEAVNYLVDIGDKAGILSHLHTIGNEPPYTVAPYEISDAKKALVDVVDEYKHSKGMSSDEQWADVGDIVDAIKKNTNPDYHEAIFSHLAGGPDKTSADQSDFGAAFEQYAPETFPDPWLLGDKLPEAPDDDEQGKPLSPYGKHGDNWDESAGKSQYEAYDVLQDKAKKLHAIHEHDYTGSGLSDEEIQAEKDQAAQEMKQAAKDLTAALGNKPNAAADVEATAKTALADHLDTDVEGVEAWLEDNDISGAVTFSEKDIADLKPAVPKELITDKLTLQNHIAKKAQQYTDQKGTDTEQQALDSLHKALEIVTNPENEHITPLSAKEANDAIKDTLTDYSGITLLDEEPEEAPETEVDLEEPTPTPKEEEAKITVAHAGDSDFEVGAVVPLAEFEAANTKLIQQGSNPADPELDEDGQLIVPKPVKAKDAPAPAEDVISALMDNNSDVIEHMYTQTYGEDNPVMSLEDFTADLKEKYDEMGATKAKHEMAVAYKKQADFKEAEADKAAAKEEKQVAQDAKEKEKQVAQDAKEKEKNEAQNIKVSEKAKKEYDAKEKLAAKDAAKNADSLPSDPGDLDKMAQELDEDVVGEPLATQHARELMAHHKKYGKDMAPETKKALMKALHEAKEHGADFEAIEKEMTELGDDFGSPEHIKEANQQAAQRAEFHQNHKNLISGTDSAAVQARDEALSHGKHDKFTDFDEDGNPIKEEGEEEEPSAVKHHVLHSLTPIQQKHVDEMKKAKAAGDEEGYKKAVKALEDSGIPLKDIEPSGDDVPKTGPPDPEVAKKKQAEGYVWHEETRSWILKETLQELKGIHTGGASGLVGGAYTGAAGLAPHPFAANEDGTASTQNYLHNSDGHLLGVGDGKHTGSGNVSSSKLLQDSVAHKLGQSGHLDAHKDSPNSYTEVDPKPPPPPPKPKGLFGKLGAEYKAGKEKGAVAGFKGIKDTFVQRFKELNKGYPMPSGTALNRLIKEYGMSDHLKDKHTIRELVERLEEDEIDEKKSVAEGIIT